MTTRKAPGAWGRGRRIVLASAFVLMLMVMLVAASAAFAVPKDKGGDGPGKSEAAPGHAPEVVEVPATVNDAPKPGHKIAAVKHPAPPKKMGGVSAKSRRRGPKVPVRSKITTGSKQDWGPNQPVSDFYDGPCTRHDDTYRKGPGHDWHRGKGIGHLGVRPSAPGTQTPSRTPTGTPGGPTIPTGGAPVTPAEEPLLPFTEGVAAEPFLPFTGGDPRMLLWLAAACALSGTGLRFQARRLHTHRRI